MRISDATPPPAGSRGRAATTMATSDTDGEKKTLLEPLGTGRGVGQYRLELQLDARPSGAFFLARHVTTNLSIELRLLTPSPARERRIRLAALVSHPHARPIVDFDFGAPTSFVALAVRPAISLAARQRAHARGPAAWEKAVEWVRDAAHLLVECHRLGLSLGVVHPLGLGVDADDRLLVDLTGLAADPTSSEDERVLEGFAVLDPAQADAVTDVANLARLLPWALGEPAGSKPAAFGRHLKTRLETRPLAAGRAAELANLWIDLHRRAIDPFAEDPPHPHELVGALDRLLAAATLSGPAHDSAASGANTARLEGLPPAAPAESPSGNVARPDAENNRAAGLEVIPASLAPAPGKRIGRFQLERELGRGGMGAVFQAVDAGDGARVALKVLNNDLARSAEAVKRFKKEARLLAQVDSPSVARLLEVNEEGGVPYLVLELVEGMGLGEYLREKGPLPEPEALALIGDVARGLGEAHARGIVHRDVKPANIVVIPGGEHRPDGAAGPSRVKILDFGLARQVIQSESLDMTKTGAFLGTPTYMAPEQCMGSGDIDPATDVYAVGVTLFQLLAGKPPFAAEDPMKLAALHCYEKPPPLQKLAPKASDGVARIVEKCLAKRQASRFANASELARELDRLARGEPTAASLHPLLPPHDPKQVFSVTWDWELKSSPSQLWPHVSNSQRLNQAAHIPPVEYSFQTDARRGVRRFGKFRLAGLAVEWEEHPFEWVEGRRMAILREFTKGPFLWFLSIIELEGLSNGGTRLCHSVKIMPRGAVGKLVAFLEVTLKGKKQMDKIYTTIDAAVFASRGPEPRYDPFGQAPRLPAARRARLLERVETLRSQVPPSILDQLALYLEETPAVELARVRPIPWARRFGFDPDQVVDGFLRATKAGLLELHWDILCPKCRVASEVKDTLRQILNHGRCEACDDDFTIDFTNSVEMIFRIHPEIRPADIKVYCAGGPENYPHVVAQVRHAPGERLELELALTPGDYALRGPQLPYAVPLRVDAKVGLVRLEVALDGAQSPAKLPAMRAGHQVLTLVNATDKLLVVRLERSVARADAVTAAKAMALALFRDLFPDQVLAPGRLVSVRAATFLAAELADTHALFRQVGDARAFELIKERLEEVEERVRHAGGAVVRREREGIFASFDDSSDAVAVAVDLRAGPAFDPDAVPMPLRAAVHRGAALALTDSDRMDYFGVNVLCTIDWMRLAEGNEVILSGQVARDPFVGAVLKARGLAGMVLASDPDGEVKLRVTMANPLGGEP